MIGIQNLRNLLPIALITCLLISCSRDESSIHTSESADPTRPNILLIVADDLGFSDIGAFGGEISTPVRRRMIFEMPLVC